MNLRCIGALVLALLLVTPAAAATSYSYQGVSYAQFTDAPYLPPEAWLFQPTMAVGGTVTFSEELPVNSDILALQWSYDFFGSWTAAVFPSFLDASFTNGIATFLAVATGEDGPFSPPIGGGTTYASLRLITDGLGDIVNWSIVMSSAPGGRGGPFNYLTSINPVGGQPLDEGRWLDPPAYERSGSTLASGTWSTVTTPAVVPLPAGLSLMAAGLALLALFGRHNRRNAYKPRLVGQAPAL